jgi:hypothetical protein
VAGSMGFVITLSPLLIGGAVVGAVAQRRAQRSRPSASGLSGLDAEAEANHWLVRLGAGLVPPDVRAWAGADEAAGRSLTHAAAEYTQVTRLAKEGLEHLRAALGPASAADGGERAEPGTVAVFAVTTGPIAESLTPAR